MTGILLVDKEQGWTSSDVVARLRGLLHERRIGHAGTLDPLATGLLVVMVGRAARASDYLMRHPKQYRAYFKPGIVTDTQDITGRVLSRKSVTLSERELEEVLVQFRGEQMQIPPMYSAIKMRGRKLYDIARRGGEVERAPRAVTVFSLTLAGRDGEEFILDVSCSAGTYIRTLCHDIGQVLGCGACMTRLQRIASGAYRVDDAHSIEEIAAAASAGTAAGLLLPVDSVFAGLEKVTVGTQEAVRIRCGGTVPWVGESGRVRVYAPSGEFLMVGRLEDGLLKTEKSFFEVP
ncbi:MAG: tRNA pseudouridine(55) synthase TruB [Oscillospiraceae bacterium]|nr:tRNA pseudouridine(55) synthase TruB [Oscillospiraceae bacterium]